MRSSLSKRSLHFAFGVTSGRRLLESGPFLTFFRPVLGGGGGSYFFFSSFFFSPPSPGPPPPGPLCWLPLLFRAYLHRHNTPIHGKSTQQARKREPSVSSFRAARCAATCCSRSRMRSALRPKTRAAPANSTSRARDTAPRSPVRLFSRAPSHLGRRIGHSACAPTVLLCSISGLATLAVRALAPGAARKGWSRRNARLDSMDTEMAHPHSA